MTTKELEFVFLIPAYNCKSEISQTLFSVFAQSYRNWEVIVIDDVSTDGLNLISEIVTVYDNYAFNTQILAASIRHTMHIIDCAKIGADVMTGSLSSIKGLLKHPLTDIGLEKFLADLAKHAEQERQVKALAALFPPNPSPGVVGPGGAIGPSGIVGSSGNIGPSGLCGPSGCVAFGR